MHCGGEAGVLDEEEALGGASGQGLVLVPISAQLELFVHRVTYLNPECVLELLKLSCIVNECKPLPPGHLIIFSQDVIHEIVAEGRPAESTR